MYKAINSLVPDAAFTLFTGDIVDHAIWKTTQAYNTDTSQSAHLPRPFYPSLTTYTDHAQSSTRTPR